MPHVELLDETLRDGQQSLWGMRLRGGMLLSYGLHREAGLIVAREQRPRPVGGAQDD